jgi:serine O-acetyltransferase
MKLFKSINEDIEAAKQFSLSNKFAIFFFNRGFHALLHYRIANKLYKWKVPVLPLILTRLIQIIYAIDIDYKANLKGGIVIVHGVGLVIGSGTQINTNVILFHGVTLGRRGIGPLIGDNDGFPVIEENCIICAGSKILGSVNIGHNTTIGANCVVTNNVPPDSVYKIPSNHFVIYNKL